MHKITKTFACDYGHRVHNQQLDKSFSVDNDLVCRHLHGHRMQLDVELEAEELTEGMVTDFKHLNWLKQFIDGAIDHKFIIDINDPLFELITSMDKSFVTYNEWYGKKIGCFDVPIMELESREFYDSFMIVDFVPTSENLSKWLFEIVEHRMADMGVVVSKVTFHETPKSKAEYSNA